MRFGRVGKQMGQQTLPELVRNAEFSNCSHDAKCNFFCSIRIAFKSLMPCFTCAARATSSVAYKRVFCLGRQGTTTLPASLPLASYTTLTNPATVPTAWRIIARPPLCWPWSTRKALSRLRAWVSSGILMRTSALTAEHPRCCATAWSVFDACTCVLSEPIGCIWC